MGNSYGGGRGGLCTISVETSIRTEELGNFLTQDVLESKGLFLKMSIPLISEREIEAESPLKLP